MPKLKLDKQEVSHITSVKSLIEQYNYLVRVLVRDLNMYLGGVADKLKIDPKMEIKLTDDNEWLEATPKIITESGVKLGK